MAVGADAAECKLHRMGFSRDNRELMANALDHCAVPLPFGWQGFGGAGEDRKAVGAVNILYRK